MDFEAPEVVVDNGGAHVDGLEEVVIGGDEFCEIVRVWGRAVVESWDDGHEGGPLGIDRGVDCGHISL